MIGANDRRGVYAANGSIEAAYKSAQWSDAYSKRVENFMKNVTDRSVPLVWILLPIMREDDASVDAKLINSIVTQAAQNHTGVTLVETWSMMIDENKAYAAYLKNAKGQSRLIRAPDGVHFTEEGYEMISDAAWARVLETSTPIRLLIQK